MKMFFVTLIAFFTLSCARVQTLNLKEHAYSERPNHVIWIQIAGFSEEHIPLLRFNVSDAANKTSIEQMDCVGKMWNFNLFELRPNASKSFLSQSNGSKNIKDTCEDYSLKPAWSYMEDINYASALLETGAKAEQSLEKALGCPNNLIFDANKTRFYKMGPEVSSVHKSFHYQDSPEKLQESNKPGMYYDRSCQKGICYSSLSNNFKTIWTSLVKEHRKTFFVVRDFNFQNGLKRKDLSFAKESLLEIDRIVAMLAGQKTGETLIVISGAESLPIEFPRQGKEWSDFEKSEKNIIYRNSTLMSPVLARGAMAENFCGIFEESEMLKRIIYKPEAKKFNWDSINPF